MFALSVQSRYEGCVFEVRGGAIYLVLVGIAIVWVGVSAHTTPAEGGESGLLPIYLTLPFSLILALILEVVSAGSLSSYLGLLLVLSVSAAANVAFLYFLGAALARKFSGAHSRT